LRRTLVAGNWKMHGSQAMVRELLGSLLQGPAPSGVETVVCPPFPYLGLAAALLEGSSIGLGAQDVHAADEGAHTGSVSGRMLRDMGCGHVIVGHSERRRECGEDDAAVTAKAQAALRAGLVPIVCVGETADERQRGETFAVVGRQLGAVLAGLGPQGAARIVVAYEPVWAIGTGLTATPAQAQEVHARLREQLAALDAGLAGAVPLLYGGSVKGANAPELFAMPDIDGGLIGGAALDAREFAAICKAAQGT